MKLEKIKGELVDRSRATALVFRLAREKRDAWVNWPTRAAALMAAELGLEAARMQKVLESHVRAHLDELAEVRPGFADGGTGPASIRGHEQEQPPRTNYHSRAGQRNVWQSSF